MKNSIIICLFIIFTSCDYSSYEEIQLRNGSTEIVKNVKVNDSLTLKYFDNNRIYQEEILQKGLGKYKEEIVKHYRKDGTLDKYSIYGNDKLKFYKFYDEKTSYGGNPLYYYNLNAEYFDTIVIDTAFSIDFKIATPPHCIPRLLYGNFVENEKKRDLSKNPLYMFEFTNGRTSVIDRFKMNGDFKRIIYWSLEDTVRNDIYKGKNVRNFHVIDKTSYNKPQ